MGNKNNLWVLGGIFLSVLFLIIIFGGNFSPTGSSVINPDVNKELEDLFEIDSDKVTVYFFWGDGCPHCTTQKPYLEEWKIKYPEIEVLEFETWSNPVNREKFKQVAFAYGVEARGVPMTFIGDKYWVGFNERMAGEMEEQIKKLI